MSKKRGLGLKELIILNSTAKEEILPKETSMQEIVDDKVYLNSINALKKGSFMEALEGFSAIVFFDRDNLKAIINLGVIYYELGLVDFAKNKFRRVLELEPDNKVARQNLSLLEED